MSSELLVVTTTDTTTDTTTSNYQSGTYFPYNTVWWSMYLDPILLADTAPSARQHLWRGRNNLLWNDPDNTDTIGDV
jgi:hypothetical protein